MSELDKQIFESIDKLLHEKKRKQIELTDYLNLNKNAYSYWKKGKSNSYRSYLVEIADFFNIPIDVLVYGKIYRLTENETEMILLFRKLSEREQVKLIGRTEEILELKEKEEERIIGRKIARRTDGEAVRIDVTEAELALMEQLPEETDF
ncbi:MAG: helix-turn-helix domain-containing protein [Ruminococcus sp.]|nr:helix-turn-helix domain-containing protein [Ruminococcus sp.]